MPQLIASKRVRARKPHRCRVCGAIAAHPGDEYTREVYVYDGTVYTWISCDPCAALFGRVWDWVADDEGITSDDYREWASDHPDDPDALAYLERAQR